MQIDFTETPDISYKTKVSNILYNQVMLQPDEINYLIDGMLAEHAHELAERLRTEAGWYVHHQREGMELAANLLDPRSEEER